MRRVPPPFKPSGVPPDSPKPALPPRSPPQHPSQNPIHSSTTSFSSAISEASIISRNSAAQTKLDSHSRKLPPVQPEPPSGNPDTTESKTPSVAPLSDTRSSYLTPPLRYDRPPSKPVTPSESSSHAGSRAPSEQGSPLLDLPPLHHDHLGVPLISDDSRADRDEDLSETQLRDLYENEEIERVFALFSTVMT